MGLFKRSNYESVTVSGSGNPMFGKPLGVKVQETIDRYVSMGYELVNQVEEATKSIFGNDNISVSLTFKKPEKRK